MGNYSKSAACGLGTTQILLGLACIGIEAARYALCFTSTPCILFWYVGYGFWGGVLFIISGSIEADSRRNPANYCLINTSMVMSIISACAAGVVTGLAGYDSYLIYFFTQSQFGLSVALAVLGFIEGIIAITASALACQAVCCGNGDTAQDYTYNHATEQLQANPQPQYQHQPVPYNPNQGYNQINEYRGNYDPNNVYLNRNAY